MLFKKSFIFTLLFFSFFTFTPPATAIEADSSTPVKKKNSSLKNKCISPNIIQGNKINKYLDRTGKLPDSSQLAKLENSPKEIVDEVWQIVHQKYVDPNFNQVDWLALRTKYLQTSYQDYSQAYADIKEMLSLLEDSYTRFLTPEEYRQITGGRKKSNLKLDTKQFFGNYQNRPENTKIAQ